MAEVFLFLLLSVVNSSTFNNNIEKEEMMLRVADISQERVQSEINFWAKNLSSCEVLEENDEVLSNYIAKGIQLVAAELREKVFSLEALVVAYYASPTVWILPILWREHRKQLSQKESYLFEPHIEDRAFLFMARHLQRILKTEYSISWKPAHPKIMKCCDSFVDQPPFESLIDSVDFEMSGDRERDKLFLRAATEAVRYLLYDTEEEYSHVDNEVAEQRIAELCIAFLESTPEEEIDHLFDRLSTCVIRTLAIHEDDRRVHECEYSRLQKLYRILSSGSIRDYVISRLHSSLEVVC